LIELIEKSVEHTQRLARGLAPLHLENTSLDRALHDLAHSASLDNDVACTLSCAERPFDTDLVGRTQLFLIAQEAIANALRHGGAKHITIELTSDDRRHLMRIIDDGAGMPAPPARSGLGLKSMAQRARLIGGALEIGPAAHRGVEVRCTW
jgi:signal transduction histidine kinase